MVRYFRTTLFDAMVRARGAERARTRVRRAKRALERLVVLVLVLGASVRLFETSGAKSDEESSSSSSSWTATEGRLRALKRDARACRVDAPTRLRALAERRLLFRWRVVRARRGWRLARIEERASRRVRNRARVVWILRDRSRAERARGGRDARTRIACIEKFEGVSEGFWLSRKAGELRRAFRSVSSAYENGDAFDE